ncbi:MAG: bifunctional phosphopantothenoylcysteine decarboxylase/phosphopantothenate--cysteine ligase CoaBC [Spartobacteria bacterium]|nr:bifunctional phosphopantothenoylcysteine decarboxylase/phosphopantothenate--cysteine ligase CoaBC [Spartobacteria bacterium]
METDVMKNKQPVALCAVCGGIAAYKAVEVVSLLRKKAFDVHVVMSRSAQQFVTPLTFQAVLGRRVITTIFTMPEGDTHEEIYPHLYPASTADLFILLPATANSIAKIACGMGDDLVCASALGLGPDCQRFFCPAMNTHMLRKPSVQKNIRTLVEQGWIQIGPGDGNLACGTTGTGRMSEPMDIVDAVGRSLSARETLSGKRVLILSGPTHEHLDPVRYISNASSGKMGKALAEAAAERGASVEMVTGPVPANHLPMGDTVHIHHVTSAADMLEKAGELFAGADAVLFAAAVADYTPADPRRTKDPKTPGDISLKLTSTPDIARTLCADKKPGQVAIGFALQDHEAEQRAREKLAQKHLDGIVLNATEAMGADAATYAYLAKGADAFAPWGAISKPDCARNILDQVVALLQDR